MYKLRFLVIPLKWTNCSTELHIFNVGHPIFKLLGTHRAKLHFFKLLLLIDRRVHFGFFRRDTSGYAELNTFEIFM